MKIVLVQNVKDLGETGDMLAVADGYAQNFLLPRKLAKKATPELIKWSEKILAERIAKKEEVVKKAKEYAEKIKKVTLTFKRKTTKDGKRLFGAISEKDIIEELTKEVKIQIEKKQVKMVHHLKEIGGAEVEIHLAEDVNVKVKVDIQPEK